MKENRIINNLLTRVESGKSGKVQIIFLSTVPTVIVFLLVALTSKVSIRTDLDYPSILISFGLLPLIVYPIAVFGVRLGEKLFFLNAIMNWQMGNWSFLEKVPLDRPHSNKFYRNPASILLIAFILNKMQYKMEATSLRDKAIFLDDRLKTIAFDSETISGNQASLLRDIWEG
ncbi:MAG: hypothetical protein JXR40_08055 [Pontiellaceae bacterium]|nr:hypothetical protein [Pontiellaceae bacterium]